MYREVTCWNTGNTYLVTDTDILPVGMSFYTIDEDGYCTPSRKNSSNYYKIKKVAVKPSIYKRDWFQCKKDEYKYAFTERTSRVTETSKDVYYNADKDRFISRNQTTTTKTKVEYGLPHLIVW
jgi:hypothetical protein